MQEVHTFRRLGVPDTLPRTVWMFGFQRRRVRTCECDTLLPKPGPLPQTSQTEATAASISWIGRVCQRLTRRQWNHQRGTEAAWEAYLTRCPRREPRRQARPDPRSEPAHRTPDAFQLPECRRAILCLPRDHAPRSAGPAAGQEGERRA